MCNREPAVPMTHVTKPVINPHHLDFLGHREETRGASGFYLVNDAEAEQIWARQMEFTLEEDTDVQMGEAGEDAARTSATVKGVLSQDVLERRGAPVEVHSHSRVSAQQTASAQAENVLIPAAQRPSLECNFPNQPSHVSALPSEAEAVDNPRSLFSRQDKTHAPRDAEAVLSLVASEVVADSEIPRKARLAGVTENPENPSVESDLPKQPDSLASMQVVQASEHLASDPGDTMLAAFAMPALEETGPRSVVPPGLDTSVPSEIEHISALPAEGAADSFHADSMPGAAEPLFLRQDETYAPMDAEAVQSLVPSPEIAAASEIPQEAPVDVTENPWSDSAFSPRSMSVSGEAETPSGAIGSMTEISGLDPAADSAGDSRSAPLLSDCEASLLVSPQQRSPPMRSLTDLVGAASANAASIDLNPPLEPAGQSAAPYAEEPAVSPTSMQWESSTPGTADVTGDCRSDVPQATGPHRKPVDVQGSHAYHPYIAVKDRPTLTERLRQRNAPLISVNVPSAQGGERDQETSGRNPSPLLQRDQDYALSGSLPPPSPAYITPSADIGLPVTAAQTDSLQPSSTNAHAQPHGKPPPSPASIAPSADIGLPVTAAQTDNLQPSSTNAHAQPHGESRTDETPGPSTYPSVQPSVSKEKSENKSLATDHPPDHDQDDLVVMAQSQSQLNLEHSSASMDSLSALVEKRSDLAENRDPSYRSPTKDYAPSVSVSTSRPVDGDGPNALNVVTEPPGDFSSSVQMQQPDAPRQDVNRPSSWQTAMTYLKSSIPVFKSFQAEPAISTHIQHTDRTAGADFEPPSSQPVPPSAAPVASDLPSSSNTQDKYFASVDSDTEMNCEPERLSAKVKGKARASPPPGWKAIDYKSPVRSGRPNQHVRLDNHDDENRVDILLCSLSVYDCS
ncbi:hypothetical protein DENSPDRAFT_109168 [Dentipellis sp. KUC8613]|nr:hypothetical protein DENSPDRAFT_109168 [Dentipellis sp. KUC8613]